MRTFAARCAGVAAAVVGIFGLIAAAPSTVHAQLFQRWCPPSAPSPAAPSAGAAGQQASGGTSAAAQQAGEASQAPAVESPSDLFAYSGAGAASGPESVGLNMVGDYLGGFVKVTNSGFANSIAIPLPGGALPRFKMSEDTSPIPTDRAYFIYDYYSGVPYNDVANGPTISLNGFTPGFEKTFLDGAMSVEVRLPMATTLGNTIYLGGGTPTGEGEIGNLGVSVKALLYRSDTAAISGGLAIDCPTAANTICVGQTADPPGAVTSNAIQIVNRSVHLLPFVGGLWTPNDRLFLMGFMQFDIDADGDSVYNGTFSGTFSGFSGPFGAPMLYCEQTMLYLDGTAGYWLRRNDGSDRYLTGIAVFGELHLDQSLDTSAGLNTQVGTMSGNSISILDMTIGADFQVGPLTTVTLAYCTPLTAQREFDGQFRLLLDRRF
jgi:hypothetical protein